MTTHHNNNIVAIPAFDLNGNLPAGIHTTAWDEFVNRFGYTPHRRRLLAGMQAISELLQQAGCSRIYIGGSFVTTKKRPNDFDGCWDAAGVNLALLRMLAPSLFDMSDGRAAQKQAFGGELFPAQVVEDNSDVTFLEFFQTDKQTGAAKGIICLEF